MGVRLIAFCGLDCAQCPGYKATQADDHDARKRVAEEWSKEFGHEFKPESINCDGCVQTEGRHIDYCSVCEIRLCGLGRGVLNCAYCPDYACDKLLKFLENSSEARENLEEIRRTI